MERPSTWHRLSALVRSLYNKEKGKSYAKDIVSYILVDDIFIDSRNIYVKEKYDMWTGLSPIGSNIGRAFFLSVLFDTTIYPWYSIRITKEKTMVDQTQPDIAHVQSKNKAINHDKQNTIKLNKAKEIYKDSNGLDNISEHLMNQFRQILSEGRQ